MDFWAPKEEIQKSWTSCFATHIFFESLYGGNWIGWDIFEKNVFSSWKSSWKPSRGQFSCWDSYYHSYSNILRSNISFFHNYQKYPFQLLKIFQLLCKLLVIMNLKDNSGNRIENILFELSCKSWRIFLLCPYSVLLKKHESKMHYLNCDIFQ